MWSPLLALLCTLPAGIGALEPSPSPCIYHLLYPLPSSSILQMFLLRHVVAQKKFYKYFGTLNLPHTVHQWVTLEDRSL